MQEFSSVSVSSYEAGSLAGQLTEQSRDGWTVVAIVPTGSTVTAYLCRDADGSSAPVAATPAETTSEPAAEPTPTAYVPEPAAEPAPAATEPAATPATPGAATADLPSEPAAAIDTTSSVGGTDSTATGDTATSDTTTSDTTAAAGAAPAGWYADPSGRFELRYWDGGQWTEHVSRAGQQYTDPPVA